VIQGPPAVARRWVAQIETHAGRPAFWREAPARVALEPPLVAVDLDPLAHGDTPLERVLSLVMLGDLVALHAASGASSKP
jgi:hypothetical protein